MALGVSVTGAVLGFTSGLTSGTVVVAILDISFGSFIITNYIPLPVTVFKTGVTGRVPINLMPPFGVKSLLRLPNGSIMLGSKGPSPNPRRDGVETELDAAAETDSGIGSISAPRWRMTPMVGLLIAWGILTTILVVLMIYKSTLTMHEDDSIFLNETESQMEKEQVEILAKVNKITPILKVLGALSGLMILVIAGLFVYQGLMMASTPQ